MPTLHIRRCGGSDHVEAALDAPTPPTVVADKVRDIIESDSQTLRYPVGADADAFLGWRASMSDEDWVGWGALRTTRGMTASAMISVSTRARSDSLPQRSARSHFEWSVATQVWRNPQERTHYEQREGEWWALNERTLTQLRARMRGAALTPNDEGYDSARQIWNTMIDRRPGVIARCTDPEDVSTAIRFTRENDLVVSIRGGGHNIAGLALCNDGLTIDLSLMKQVTVDSAAATASAQAGLTWGEFDRETKQFGLATTAAPYQPRASRA